MNRCRVKGCRQPAIAEVILYDLYLTEGDIFFETDRTCPYICLKHLLENENNAQGEKVPRGFVTYPYTNQDLAQGFNIYRPLEKEEKTQQPIKKQKPIRK